MAAAAAAAASSAGGRPPEKVEKEASGGPYGEEVLIKSWINIHQCCSSLSVKAKYLNEHSTRLLVLRCA